MARRGEGTAQHNPVVGQQLIDMIGMPADEQLLIDRGSLEPPRSRHPGNDENLYGRSHFLLFSFVRTERTTQPVTKPFHFSL